MVVPKNKICRDNLSHPLYTSLRLRELTSIGAYDITETQKASVGMYRIAGNFRGY